MVFLDTVMPSSVDASTVSMFWIGVPPRERASRSMRIGRSVGMVTRPGKGSGGPQRPRQDRRKSDVGVAGVCEARRVVRSGRYPVTTLAGPPAWLAAGGSSRAGPALPRTRRSSGCASRPAWTALTRLMRAKRLVW